MIKTRTIAILMLVSLMNADKAQSQENNPVLEALQAIKLPTLGGMQFWTDLRWWHGWRLQENQVTDHCRILDGSNVRHYFGSRAECEAQFQKYIDQNEWPEAPEKVVVFLHGLMRTHRSYLPLGKRVAAEIGMTPIYFGYASTRSPISSHAQALRGFLEGLPGNPKIHIVGHSLGNIVTRHAIADWNRDGDPRQVLKRLERFVMQGPPNQGAEIAKRLRSLDLFEIVTGRSGIELGGDWNSLKVNLATPSCQFGIVAGQLDTGPVRNPLVEGASDFVVSVEEAKLPGARDFLVLPVLHSFLMDDSAAQDATIRFLNTGAFSEDGKRNPL